MVNWLQTVTVKYIKELGASGCVYVIGYQSSMGIVSKISNVIYSTIVILMF